MAKKLTSSKAKEILRDNTAHGKPLTSKQKRYFGYVAGGGKAENGGWLDKYQDGGNVSKRDSTIDNYFTNVNEIDDWIRNNFTNSNVISKDNKRQLVSTQAQLMSEIPMGSYEVSDLENYPAINYFNDLVGRNKQHINSETADVLNLSNRNPVNVYKKASLLRDMDINKNDLDSLKKYIPNFYEDYNLGLAKPFLPKEENGGKIKYEDGGKLSPKQFTQQYIQSPKYKERLSSSGYDVNDEIANRLTNVNKIKTYGQYGGLSQQKQIEFDQQSRPYTKGGSSYIPEKDAIIIDHKQAKEKSILPQYIEAHEFGHAETDVSAGDYDVTGIRKSRLNTYDNENIINRLGENANPIFKEIPDEIKADMNSLRYELYNKGIYDAGTEDFKLENLQKLDNSYIKDRLLKSYSEEDLEWLMNNIASTVDNSSLSTIAKSGTTLKKSKQLRTFTNGWVDKYL